MLSNHLIFSIQPAGSFFDRLDRVSDLFDDVPQFSGGNAELLRLVADFVGLGEADPAAVQFAFLFWYHQPWQSLPHDSHDSEASSSIRFAN
jgi:hypothetical protein